MKLLNVSISLLALAGFAGCVDGYTSSRGNYYSGRIWNGTPYCSNSYDYGCDYDNYDGGRIGGIWGRRGYEGGFGGGFGRGNEGGRGFGRGNEGGGFGRGNEGGGFGRGNEGGGFGRGNEGGGFGRGGRNHDMVASEVTASASVSTSGPAAWQKEFALSNSAVSMLKAALDAGLRGDASKLVALGVEQADVQRLGNFEMPSSTSIARVARTLGVSQQNLADFVEVYTIRLKTALASNQR